MIPVSRFAFHGLGRGHCIAVLILILCLGLACCSPFAHAQGFDATTLREPTDLAAGWLVHAGDDPAYARLDFDDSHWTPFDASTDSLHKLFPNSRPEVVWYRLRVKVVPNQNGLGLLEKGISRAFELYSNGGKLIDAGQVAPYVPYETAGFLLRSIPDSQISTGSIVIALRVHTNPIDWVVPQPGLKSVNLTLGQVDILRDRMWYSVIRAHALEWLDDLVNIGMLLGALVLYSTQRDRPEYFWLSLWILIALPGVALSQVALFHTFPKTWHIVDLLSMAYPYCLARMYCAFVGHRVGWRLQIYLGVACLGMGHAILSVALGSLTFNLNAIDLAPIAVLALVILPAIMIVQFRSGNRAEGILILPLLMTGLSLAGSVVLVALMQIPTLRDWARHSLQSIDGTMFGPFYVSYQSLADILSMVALALIILSRSNRMSRQRALLEGEVAAAREVQQVILPQQVEAVPGFAIESVYEPAQQVGGDFFQILPTSGDGLLVVVGDVAGKGLPAAMLVSVLVGTIRTVADDTHSPETLLRKLNESLVGRARGGFSTALAAHISSDGLVMIANAGHLSPYLDGKEIELPGALPLGVVSGTKYEPSQFQLERGSRLTFYSDGVIEAQNQKGELFGFERGREISAHSAATIVEAAKKFGQEDDITVITIQRVAIGDESTNLVAGPLLAPA